jgi:DNA-directed RNA polymerase subunit M/transcription elongation factor TFIIS
MTDQKQGEVELQPGKVHDGFTVLIDGPVVCPECESIKVWWKGLELDRKGEPGEGLKPVLGLRCDDCGHDWEQDCRIKDE